MEKRKLISIGIIVFLLIAIPVTFFLAQHQQIFRPRASAGDWIFCANEFESCSLSGGHTVRFGVEPGPYVGRTFEGTSISCNVDTFGSDPAPGVTKHCDYQSPVDIGTPVSLNPPILDTPISLNPPPPQECIHISCPVPQTNIGCSYPQASPISCDPSKPPTCGALSCPNNPPPPTLVDIGTPVSLNPPAGHTESCTITATQTSPNSYHVVANYQYIDTTAQGACGANTSVDSCNAAHCSWYSCSNSCWNQGNTIETACPTTVESLWFMNSKAGDFQPNYGTNYHSLDATMNDYLAFYDGPGTLECRVAKPDGTLITKSDVTVNQPAGNAGGSACSVNLTSDKSTLAAGGTVTLSWTSTGSSTVQAIGGWGWTPQIGQTVNLDRTGSKTTDPLTSGGTYIFTARCTGTDGITRQSLASVTVTGAPVTGACLPPRVAGDSDKNGVTDLIDFAIWGNEFTGGDTFKQADFDCNGRVDLVDFAIWANAYVLR